MTRIQFAKKFSKEYNWLLKNNLTLLNVIFPKYHKEWSKIAIQNEAIKYRTKNEWKRQSANSYKASFRYGGPDCYSTHMINTQTIWSLESCKEESIKYKTKKEWENADKKSYSAAIRNGWSRECCMHMPDNNYIRQIVNKDSGVIYKNMTLAARSVNTHKSNVHNAIKNSTKCGGYHWTYCDENGKVLDKTKKK